MAWRRWNRGRVLAFILLLVVLVPTVFIGGKEYARLFHVFGAVGEESDDGEEEVRRPVVNPAEQARSVAAVETARGSWTVGPIVQKNSASASAYYEATIIDAGGREVFKLKLNPAGVPFQEKRPATSGPALSEAELRIALPKILSQLVVTVSSGGEEDEGSGVGLAYNGATVARIRLTAGRQQSENRQPESNREQRSWWNLSERQMNWTGWAATILLVLSLLYWPLKRLRFFVPRRLQK
ncbi:MAG: hypothetical protein Q7O66_02295 [Dehalococcoidia bacterium]|nr:hypothetical protein [Dehalococcoidia bacterium]